MKFFLSEDTWYFIKWFTIWFLVFAGIMLLVYIIFTLFNKSSILKTVKPAGSETKFDADQFYYLPSCLVRMDMTAAVLVKTAVSDGRILAKTLSSLVSTNTVSIEPDTSQLLLLKYIAFAFANDELTIKTNPSGLLENISSVTEDRISSIIAKISDAPAQILQPQKKAGIVADDATADNGTGIYGTQVFTASFTVRPEDHKSDMVFNWKVSLTGAAGGLSNIMDLSFAVDIENFRKPYKFGQGKLPFDGVLTRPMVRTKMDIYAAKNGKKKPGTASLASTDIFVPDHSLIINVPIRRYNFVKNQYMPGFSDGLLIQNYINKPSQFEGFSSIPINILRAIFSIPSEIFNFKIAHLQQQTSLEKETQNLATVRAASKPNPVNMPAGLGDTKYGKPPADNTIQTYSLKKVSRKLMFGEAAEDNTPEIPNSHTEATWPAQYNGDWGMYYNDGLQTCTPAAAAHCIINWTANSNSGNATVPEPEPYMTAYTTLGHYVPGNPKTDKGCAIPDFLAYWARANGVGGDKIDRYLPFTIKSQDELQIAVFWYGAAMIGLRMPATITDNPEIVTWEYDPAYSGRMRLHTVAAVGYDPDGVTIISWGRAIHMKWAFYQNYNDESWVMLSLKDWAPGTTAPSQMSGNDLAVAINSLRPQA